MVMRNCTGSTECLGRSEGPRMERICAPMNKTRIEGYVLPGERAWNREALAI